MRVDYRRPPIVTDADRQWSLDQQPPGWDAAAPWLPWGQHVAEQIDAFESYFAEDRKPPEEWSGLWRRVWWPKADPAIKHPRDCPPGDWPVARRGDAVWPQVLNVLDSAERRVAERFGAVQLRPTDPRSEILKGGRCA